MANRADMASIDPAETGHQPPPSMIHNRPILLSICMLQQSIIKLPVPILL